VRAGGAGLAACLLAAGNASAAETTVNFDSLTPGTAVTTQYEAQGLKMGTAAGVGFPGVATADCGAPTVTKGTASIPAPSPPNCATVLECAGGARGTYGALPGHPRGALSSRCST
jgi:hypothetical protein